MSKFIQITSKVDGFRRGGVAHPAAPTIYPASRFDEKQLGIFDAEPGLMVKLLDELPDGKDAVNGRPVSTENDEAAIKAHADAADTLVAAKKALDDAEAKATQTVADANAKANTVTGAANKLMADAEKLMAKAEKTNAEADVAKAEADVIKADAAKASKGKKEK